MKIRGNACYQLVKELLSSHLLSKNVNIKVSLFKIVILTPCCLLHADFLLGLLFNVMLDATFSSEESISPD
jgi:hypothetical protein